MKWRLFKKKEQKGDLYKNYDPFKPKIDPYKKMIKAQEKLQKTRAKIASISFIFALLISIFNLILVLIRIDALSRSLIVYTYPLSFLLLTITFFYGINLLGKKRVFSIGTKLSFVVLVINLSPFYFLSQIKSYEKLVLSILYLISSYLLLLLVAVIKDKFSVTKTPPLLIFLLILSIIFNTMAILLPLYGV